MAPIDGTGVQDGSSEEQRHDDERHRYEHRYSPTWLPYQPRCPPLEDDRVSSQSRKQSLVCEAQMQSDRQRASVSAAVPLSFIVHLGQAFSWSGVGSVGPTLANESPETSQH